MSELTALQTRLAGLIAVMLPEARRKMAADIAKQLRTSQQQRIKRQQTPDGTPYAARKPQLVRSEKGRIKREMFSKLRASRYMKTRGTDNAAVVEFTGRVQRIARVHQYGLKDRPWRSGHDVRYAERTLLGVSREDRRLIENVIIRHLSR